MSPADRADPDVRALLPFHVNGTLDAAEQAAVEAALAADPALAREAEALARARRTLRAMPVDAPGAAGLDRLMGALDAEAPAAPTAAPANIDRAPLWRAAAAILLAVALAQAAWIATRPAAEGATYELAGGAGGADAPRTGTIRAAFRPDTAEADLRALLRAAGLSVVGGPSALGLWTLAPLAAPQDVPVDAPEDAPADATDAALAALRASPFLESADRIP